MINLVTILALLAFGNCLLIPFLARQAMTAPYPHLRRSLWFATATLSILTSLVILTLGTA